MITVIFFILIYILIIMTLGFLIYSYINYLKIVKEIDKTIEEADKAIEEDLKYGLGEMKPYYCKGDYIWLDESGNITSKSRQDGDW